MNRQDLAAILFKLFGVTCLLLSCLLLQMLISSVVSIYSTRSQWPDASITLLRLFQIAILFILPITGLVFAIRPKQMASRFFPASESTSATTTTPAELQPILFSAVGAFAIVTAIPPLAETLSAYISLREVDIITRQTQMAKMRLPSIIGTLAYLAMGMWLFCGSKGVAHLWSLLQKTRPMKRQ